MIGHKILLHSGDSTSRILPISSEGNQYLIQFSDSFGFEPSALAGIVDLQIQKTNIAESYLVEMVTCDSQKVVYSYEVGNKKNAVIMPCIQRVQPKGCYSLMFTLLKTPKVSQETEPFKANKKWGVGTILLFLFLGLILFLSLGYFFQKRNQKKDSNPNLIQMGEFQFDRLNMILLLKEQKIELTGKEADLLLLLYKDVNKTIEKEVILSSVWGDEGDYVGRTLDVFISKLRKKLEFDPKVKIVNIRGVGYRLVMEMEG
jgi:hypothetical protein